MRVCLCLRALTREENCKQENKGAWKIEEKRRIVTYDLPAHNLQLLEVVDAVTGALQSVGILVRECDVSEIDGEVREGGLAASFDPWEGRLGLQSGRGEMRGESERETEKQTATRREIETARAGESGRTGEQGKEREGERVCVCVCVLRVIRRETD